MRIFLLPLLAGLLGSTASAETHHLIQRDAIRKFTGDIATAVPNPKHEPCYSRIDCRRKGHELSTVFQMNHTKDYGPEEYPHRCYTPGAGGKYVFLHSAC